MFLCQAIRSWSVLVWVILSFICLTFSNSKLPYDVTPEQALSHEEVRTRLDASIRNMRTVTDKFLSAIISSVDKIPWVWCTSVIPEKLLTSSCLQQSYLAFSFSQLWNAFHCQGPKRFPAWQVSWCWRGWASEGEDLHAFVNNCQPDGPVASAPHSSLLLGVCVERSACKPIHLPLQTENISRQAIAVSFIHVTWDVIHCLGGGILVPLFRF